MLVLVKVVNLEFRDELVEVMFIEGVRDLHLARINAVQSVMQGLIN